MNWEKMQYSVHKIRLGLQRHWSNRKGYYKEPEN